jgi:hypothetical protein
MRTVFHAMTGKKLKPTKTHEAMGMNHHALIFAAHRNAKIK